ncbi:MAG: SRPBCC domain-containing protein [Thermoplasmata archaeon]|nr:SRPBCC domain-containing protein [Thermoplasmata archaeon]
MVATTLTVRQSYRVNAPVSKVFRALSEPSELTKWFLGQATLPHRRGGTYEFVWPGGYRHEGRVLEYVVNRRLSLTWPSAKLGDTKVTFTVQRSGRGTRLDLRHTGYRTTRAWLEMYGGTQSGWAYYLMNLKSVLENGHDLRDPSDLQ